MTDSNQRILTQHALADLAELAEAGVRSRWVRSGPLRLHLLDYGGPGTPVLILPGITTPAVCMDFVARSLRDVARPVALDVRGRGLSDSGPCYDLDAYATDCEAVIATLGLDHPVLLGHSMGARIATAVAARARQPLGGTVLVDPPMSGPGRGPYPTTAAAFQTQLDQARRGTTADEVAAFWPGWPRREHQLRARWLASCSARAVAETHAGFESEDFFDWWPSVPAPAVLIYGGASPVVTSAGAAEAALANPHADIVEVPGAGHMVFWDEPARGLAAVRAALRGLAPPGRAHLWHGQLSVVDDKPIIQVEAVAPHRDVEVARRVIRAAELVVRADREHDVAVERPQLHPHPATELRQPVPVRPLVKPPPDMRHPVPSGVAETLDVGRQQLGVESAPDVADEALLDRQGHRCLDVGVERQQDIAG